MRLSLCYLLLAVANVLLMLAPPLDWVSLGNAFMAGLCLGYGVGLIREGR